jgi:hypothetical protein
MSGLRRTWYAVLNHDTTMCPTAVWNRLPVSSVIQHVITPTGKHHSVSPFPLWKCVTEYNMVLMATAGHIPRTLAMGKIKKPRNMNS